jgi:site-specific DNA recombinase
MAREIQHIPARREVVNRAATRTRKIRLAAYCRVSTNNEDQLLSFENQVTYYKDYAARHPEYELVEIYADEGISGTSTRHRDEFNRMIADCEAGKIDMIITKSISRFARNTADCLKYSRQLRDLGIAVQFEKESINTLEGSGELLFTILSSLAQDESRSISENTTWGIRSLFRQGKLHLNANRFLGYDKDEKGQLIINKEQAAIVRRIYSEYMNGLSPDVIARQLQDERVPGVMGEPKWVCATIQGILQNEKYTGDALLQKTFTADFLTKKMVKNEGQIEQFWVKDNHEPIIDKEAWQAVQLEIKRRRDYMERYNLRTMGRYTDGQPFSNRVICGKCGRIYWRRTWYRLNKTVKVWQCETRYKEKGVPGCGSNNLHEEDLFRGFVYAWNTVVEEREEHIPEWERLEAEGDPLQKHRARQMIELTAAGTIEDIDFALVGKVIDHCVVHNRGFLKFFFLDGSSAGVTVAD